MMNDPFANSGKSQTGYMSGASKDSGGYVAFGTKDKVNRLRIRSNSAPVNSPGYNILLNVVYDPEGTNFVLVYSVLMVLVRGKNLLKLIFAIENGMADFIEEFDSQRWQAPSDANAAVIESIQIKAAESGQLKEDTEH